MRLINNILFLLITCTSLIYAQQTYPVKSSIQVKYPSVFLDEYADNTNTSASITLLDLQKQDYKVLVHLSLESADLKLTSKEPIRLTISGGVPEDLNFSDPDIAKLFSFNNLLPTKGKVAEFNTSKILPEGVYLLKLDVYDANFPNLNVSNVNANITTLLVQRYDPPFLNLPQDKVVVDQDPFSPNIFFSWAARGVVANPFVQVFYALTLVEVPDGRNPYDAINIAGSTYPITMLADSGITFPTYTFTPEMLPLHEGRTYAWQVTAYEQDPVTGSRRYQRFKNNG
ncbi:MAG TPA: hypothetical protein VL947_00825, partial [Cytophagales bacterium]|nr:hypothetical protein [Cytophagales bacterium]